MTKRKFDRASSWRCIEYWLNRGYTVEEARQHISTKQSQISKKQQGKVVSEASKINMSKAALKRNDPSYWIQKYGSNAEKEQAKYKQRLRDNARNSIIKRDNISSTPRRKEFWLKRGFTAKEAELKVSETQSTFSFDKCRAKYGEEGDAVWKARQLKWRKSFDSNDTEAINKKRKEHAHVGFYSKKNIPIVPLTFYILEVYFDQEVWLKYGVTKHSVKKRWGLPGSRLKYKILLECVMDPEKAIDLETKLRDAYRKQSFSERTKLTEIISLTKKQEVCKILEQYNLMLNGV